MEQGRITDRKHVRAGGQWLAGRWKPFFFKTVLCGVVAFSWAAARTAADSRGEANFEKFRVIAEKNMFGRHRGVEEKPEPQSKTPLAAIPAEVKVVGIVRRSDPLASIAILEEGGRHKLCRVGDRVGTLILRSIRDHDIIFETPTGHWLAEIEPGMVRHRAGVPPTEPDAAGFVRAHHESESDSRPRLPIRAFDVRQLARAGLITYTEDGVVKGLQLTRDAIGLKQGDRLTYVDGQALCTRRPKQKLWQIVRKHRASKDRLAEIHVVIERNNHPLEFLVRPVG